MLRGSRQFPGMRLESHSDVGSQVSRDPCGRAVLGINQLRAPPKAWRPLENSKREFLAAKKCSKKMLQERVCNALITICSPAARRHLAEHCGGRTL